MSTILFILDKETKELIPVDDTMAWGKWFEDIDNRRVERTDVLGGFVSTVFLGTPHIGKGGGLNGFFETMSFIKGEEDGQERCETWAEAEMMHKRMVQKYEKVAA